MLMLMMLWKHKKNAGDTLIREIVLDGPNRTGSIRTMSSKRSWIKHVAFAQKLDYNHFGAYFCSLLKNRNQHLNTRIAWLLSSILTKCKELWSLTDACESNEACWHGWMLAHLSNKCYFS